MRVIDVLTRRRRPEPEPPQLTDARREHEAALQAAGTATAHAIRALQRAIQVPKP